MSNIDETKPDTTSPEEISPKSTIPAETQATRSDETPLSKGEPPTSVADEEKSASSDKSVDDKPTSSPTIIAAEPIPESPKTIEVKETPKPTPQKIYALVVDDEPANRDFLMRLLEQATFEVFGAFNAKQAMEFVEREGDKIKLAMIDHVLPDSKGTDLVQKIHEKLPNTTIVMATMHDERAMMREAFDSGCAAFLVKPHGFMELFKRVQGIQQDISRLEKLHGLIFDQYGPRPWRAGE